MGKKTTKRAVLLNRQEPSSTIEKIDFSAFLKEFLKSSKKERASPPTKFEKVLIAKPLKTIKANLPTDVKVKKLKKLKK